MSSSDVILIVGLAALIIYSSWGTRPFSPQRILLPMVVSTGAAFHYLSGIPTAGADLTFITLCGLAGVAFGLLAASQVRIHRDEATGRVMMTAGIRYAAVWVAIFGGRLGFAWEASHSWGKQIAQFSSDHQITGQAAWTAAFIAMAMAMVLTRTAVNAGRAYMLQRGDGVSANGTLEIIS